MLCSILGDITGEFDAISPATQRRLGTSAGRERVRLGTQGGLAGRRKPTRTHLRAGDSGDELWSSDAEVLTEDSAGGGSSNNDSPVSTHLCKLTCVTCRVFDAPAFFFRFKIRTGNRVTKWVMYICFR